MTATQPARRSKIDVAAVEAMLADGLSHREIARTLGVSRTIIDTRWPGTGWNFKDAGAFGAALRGNAIRNPGDA